MATEDIELTWRLLLAGWETVYEPHTLVGMQVPRSLGALWAQRTRWARGQGEVIHAHLREVVRWRNRRMWMLTMEALASLIWIIALVASLVIAALGIAVGGERVFGFALAWGIAISLVATLQLLVALWLERGYDPTALRALLLGALPPPYLAALARVEPTPISATSRNLTSSGSRRSSRNSDASSTRSSWSRPPGSYWTPNGTTVARR